MKKYIVLLLVVLMALSVVACSADPDKNNTDSTTASVDVNTETKPATVPQGTGIDVDSVYPDDKNDIKVEVNTDFEEEVVFDDNDIKVSVTEISNDDLLGPCVTFLVENSSDKNIFVTTANLSINDCAVTTSLFAEVAAGKSTYQDMYVFKSSLNESNITEVGKIEFILEVQDADSFDYVAKSEIITLILDSNVNQEFTSDGEVIYNSDGVTVYCEAPDFKDDGINDYVAKFLIINDTGKNIRLTADNTSVDGFMIYPLFYAEIPAGKCGYAHISFMQDELEESNISDIKEVEFILQGFDSDTVDLEFESDIITIKAK